MKTFKTPLISLCLLTAIISPLTGHAKKKQQSTDPALKVVQTAVTTITEITYADGSVATTAVTDTLVSDKTSRIPATATTPEAKINLSEVPDPFGTGGTPPHFTWGVDIGSGVDLTAHDMTMFEISACVGYKNPWLRFAGIGAEIISMMNNSSRCYPVYAMVRTSFSPYHRLCFLEAKAGASFSSFLSYGSQTNFYGSLGVGLTLAHSRKFTSHVILRGVVLPLSPVTLSDGSRALNYTIAYAAIGLGCAF